MNYNLSKITQFKTIYRVQGMVVLSIFSIWLNLLPAGSIYAMGPTSSAKNGFRGFHNDNISSCNPSPVSPQPSAVCTAGPASSTPTLCINTPLPTITHSTTGATGIGTPVGLPAGVTASWASNTITIGGTPTAAGVFNYSIILTGSCNNVYATGSITVNENSAITSVTGTTPLCIGATTTYAANGAVLGGGTGIWSSSNTSVATVDPGSGLVSGLSAGTADIVYTIAGGCGSSAGSGWVIRNSASDLNWQSVAHDGSKFVVVGRPVSGLADAVMTSTDGDTWTNVPHGLGPRNINDIIYANNMFVAVSSDVQSGLSNGTAMYSMNGTAWTLANAPRADWQSVAYGNGTFVAVASFTVTTKVMTSPDGINWTNRTPSSVSNIWRGVTFGNGLFVAVAASSPLGDPTIMTSTDGISWTAVTPPGNAGSWAVAYGNGLFAAVSQSGGIMTSPDGVNWTTRTSPVNNAWKDITYGSGRFVAVASSGNGNRAMSSVDGINWVAEVSAADNKWTGLTYANGKFVAVADSGLGNRVMVSYSGSGQISAQQALTVAANSNAGPASSLPTVCLNTPLIPITHNTSGANGIGTPAGLPPGVSASWTSNTITISGTPTASGSFSYNIPLTGGCGSSNATGTITVNAASTYFEDSDGDGFGNPAISQQACTMPSGFVTNNGDCNDSNPTINPTQAEICNGVDDDCDGITDNATVPVIGSITGAFQQCIPLAPGTSTFSVGAVPGVTNYSWTLPSGLSIVSGQGSNTITVTWTVAAAHLGIIGPIAVTPGTTCASGNPSTAVLDLNYTQPVRPSSISGPAKLCPGDAGTFSVQQVARARFYTWTVPAGIVITDGQGTNAITFTVNSSYSGGDVQVAASNSCGTGPSRSRTVLRNTPLAPAVITGPVSGLCGLSNVVYSTTGSSAATSYVWTVPAGVSIVSGQGSNSITVNISAGFTSGKLMVAGSNSCGTGPSRSLTLCGTPQQAGPISGPVNICPGASGVVYAVSPVSGATSYIWTVPGGVTINSGQGSTTINVTYGTNTATGQVITIRPANACGNGSLRQLANIAINPSFCGPRLSSKHNLPEDFEIYPNPATGTVQLRFTSAEASDYRIRIVDVIGRTVLLEQASSLKGFQTKPLNLQGLISGIYFVLFERDNNAKAIRLLIE